MGIPLNERPALTYTKEHQLKKVRTNPTRKQRSNPSEKVRKQVHYRSNQACERCDRARSTELAHIERRWKSESKPTAECFAHLCTECHDWADSCKEGRQWLIDFQKKLRG